MCWQVTNWNALGSYQPTNKVFANSGLWGNGFPYSFIEKEHPGVLQNVSAEAGFEDFGTCKPGQRLAAKCSFRMLWLLSFGKTSQDIEGSHLSCIAAAPPVSTAGVFLKSFYENNSERSLLTPHKKSHAYNVFTFKNDKIWIFMLIMCL